MNQIVHEITVLLDYLRDHGSLAEWHTMVVYAHPAVVTGSDGLAYASVQNSTGEDPVTDTSNTYWELFGSVADGSITLAKLATFILPQEYIPGISADKLTSGTVATVRLPHSSSTGRGIVELATVTEAKAGADTSRAVTSAGLAGRTPDASDSAKGLVELASAAETRTGTDTTTAVPPGHLGQADVDKVDGKHLWTGTEAEYDAIASPDADRIYVQT